MTGGSHFVGQGLYFATVEVAVVTEVLAVVVEGQDPQPIGFVFVGHGLAASTRFSLAGPGSIVRVAQGSFLVTVVTDVVV